MEYVKLKNIAKYPTGKLDSNAAVNDGKYPFFTCAQTAAAIDTYAYDGEYVLLGGNNANGNFPVFYYKGKFNAYQRTYLIQPTSDIIDTKYLYYVIRLKINQMRSNASGTATKFLTKPILDNINIEYRSIVDQRRIASILSEYDDLIENNHKRIQILEKMAENLYKEWFVRFHFPGHEQAEFENGIPKGWKWARIDDYYDTGSGGTPSRSNPLFYENGKLCWVKTGELKDTVIIDTEEHITSEGLAQSSAKLYPANSIMMAMYAGENIGKLAYIDREMACNQACCVFTGKRGNSSMHYLFYYIKSIRNYLRLISFGAAQQNISQDIIKKIKMMMPSTEILSNFERSIDPLYLQVRNLAYSNYNLQKQRDLLLPRLMNGTLEI